MLPECWDKGTEAAPALSEPRISAEIGVSEAVRTGGGARWQSAGRCLGRFYGCGLAQQGCGRRLDGPEATVRNYTNTVILQCHFNYLDKRPAGPAAAPRAIESHSESY